MATEQQTRITREFYKDADGYDAIDKRPDEVADYQLDFSSNLDSGDTISTDTWTVPTGITEDSNSNDTTTATVWLSGGTAGQKYLIQCQVVTAQGRTKDRQFRVYVKN